MFRTSFSTTLAVAFLLLAPVASASRDSDWNLIAIVTDDQASWAVGAYGNDEIVTPNLDRLANEGVRFTNAFVTSPVCTPSRATYLTGLYSQQSGIHDVQYLRDLYEALPLGLPTWPRLLKQHGYRTGLIGKWHLGRAASNHPTEYGIDYFFGFVGGSNSPINPVLERNREVIRHEGSLPDILTDDAIRFIGDNKNRPFALMLHYRAPHAPHLPVPDEDLAPYDGLDPTTAIVDPGQSRMDDDQDSPSPEALALHHQQLKKNLVGYYASVHSVDRNIGRLRQALQSMDLSRKTIIVFTSDNGFLYGHRGLKGKGLAQPIWNHTLLENSMVVNMFEDSLRVPLIVYWPGVGLAGETADELVSNIDMFPSYLGMLGIPMPADSPSQGYDFSPLVKGVPTDWRDTLYADFSPDQTGNIEFLRMARTKKWKLVRAYLNPGASRLYDLVNDPQELSNLYVPEKISVSYVDQSQIDPETSWNAKYLQDPLPIQLQLEKRLRDWQESINDPVSEMEQIWESSKDDTFRRWERKQ